MANCDILGAGLHHSNTRGSQPGRRAGAPAWLDGSVSRIKVYPSKQICRHASETAHPVHDLYQPGCMTNTIIVQQIADAAEL